MSDPNREIPEHDSEGQHAGSAVYDYYFEAQRPAFVDRLIERKHRAHLLRLHGLSRPQSVLEIGPGEGWFAHACRAAGLSYWAVEASERGAERMREQGFDVVVGRVPPMPEELPSVDLVYASHLVEHLPSPAAVVDLLVEIRQHLTSRGVVALAFPDARALGIDFWDCDYTHTWPSTPRRVAQAANDAGYSVSRVFQTCLEFEGWKARLLGMARRLFPHRLLSRAFPDHEDFFFRGRMLLAPESVVLLSPRR